MIGVLIALVLAPPTAGNGNLIVNGNFDAGATGFKTEYHLMGELTPTGALAVGKDPQKYNFRSFSMPDHTGNHGNMLIVNSFEAFDKANIRSIATAARIAYMSLSGDLNGTSYSSGRIGLLAERAVFRSLQKRLIERICQRVYRRWLRMALLSGLDVGTVDASQLLNVEWHPRSFPWVDPTKDIDASLREVDAGLDSLTAIAARKGRDFKRIVDERSEEIEYAKAKGVPIVISTGPKESSASLDETAEPEDASGAEDDGADETPKKKKPAPKNGNGTTNGHAAQRIVSRLMRGAS